MRPCSEGPHVPPPQTWTSPPAPDNRTTRPRHHFPTRIRALAPRAPPRRVWGPHNLTRMRAHCRVWETVATRTPARRVHAGASCVPRRTQPLPPSSLVPVHTTPVAFSTGRLPCAGVGAVGTLAPCPPSAPPLPPPVFWSLPEFSGAPSLSSHHPPLSPPPLPPPSSARPLLSLSSPPLPPRIPPAYPPRLSSPCPSALAGSATPHPAVPLAPPFLLTLPRTTRIHGVR